MKERTIWVASRRHPFKIYGQLWFNVSDFGLLFRGLLSRIPIRYKDLLMRVFYCIYIMLWLILVFTCPRYVGPTIMFTWGDVGDTRRRPIYIYICICLGCALFVFCFSWCVVLRFHFCTSTFTHYFGFHAVSSLPMLYNCCWVLTLFMSLILRRHYAQLGLVRRYWSRLHYYNNITLITFYILFISLLCGVVLCRYPRLNWYVYFFFVERYICAFV